MDRLYKPSSIRREPIIAVVWVLALGAIFGGLWVLSPWLSLVAPSGSTAIYNTAASTVGLVILGGAAVVSGFLMVIGILRGKKKFIRSGLLINIILRTYATLIALLVFGFETSMISTITLLAITILCYVALRDKG